jgi:hypothetical protein
MKTSNILLLSGIGLIILALTGGMIVVRVLADKNVSIGEVKSIDTTMQEKSYEITDFSGIETSGFWKIKMTKGDSYSVVLRTPAYLADQVIVGERGGTLFIGFAPGTRISMKESRAEAVITMPELSRIESSGGSSISFSGFSGDLLDIDISGGSDINGKDSSFKNIRMDISGAVNVDCRETKAENALINISGAGNVEITMTGGILSGNLSGTANITYYGDVSEERFKKSGFTSIQKR